MESVVFHLLKRNSRIQEINMMLNRSDSSKNSEEKSRLRRIRVNKVWLQMLINTNVRDIEREQSRTFQPRVVKFSVSDIYDPNYSLNKPLDFFNEYKDDVHFREFRFECLRKRAVERNIVCEKKNRMLSSSNVYQIISRKKNPCTLVQLASAASVSVLEKYDVNVLGSLSNQLAHREIRVRVGPDTKRRVCDFYTILKHIMYWKVNRRIVHLDYFRNLKIEPRTFCDRCFFQLKGIYQRCNCILCDANYYGLMYARPYDTTFHYEGCSDSGNRC